MKCVVSSFLYFSQLQMPSKVILQRSLLIILKLLHHAETRATHFCILSFLLINALDITSSCCRG